MNRNEQKIERKPRAGSVPSSDLDILCGVYISLVRFDADIYASPSRQIHVYVHLHRSQQVKGLGQTRIQLQQRALF